ncbi:hypothetical protein [Massilia pseudoviolaceinigra]|uniref:hypothetical protein n=1 Tax=Massilia pseudoviolaceinigra TaxID=3057165 RepID=UPI0027964B55|nr:hypothetical protein [Massilia sp. CCM 9206]MDQ1919828.1 hypothetical protein [Massilia sp. CCM 9206]
MVLGCEHDVVRGGRIDARNDAWISFYETSPVIVKPLGFFHNSAALHDALAQFALRMPHRSMR